MKPTQFLYARHLVKAIRSRCQYAVIDVQGDQLNPKITFTNQIEGGAVSIPGKYYIIDIKDNSELVNQAIHIVESVTASWGKLCYHYASFDEFLREIKGISQAQYRAILRFAER